MSYQQIISYYRDCYKEDSASINLWNVNKLKQEDRLILKGQDELGTGFLPRLPIPEEFAAPMLKRVAIYQRERVLLYARFLFVGKVSIKGELKTIISPLLFNEATIEQDKGNFYFCVQDQTPEINEALLQQLLPEDNELSEQLFSEDTQSPSFWTSYFNHNHIEISSLELLQYPKLAQSGDIKKALTKKTPSLLPISMLIFVERSTSSRGVLHELDNIINANELSASIAKLFNHSIAKPNEYSWPPKLKYDFLPGLLSSRQKKVIAIAANASLGCVSGPPGTGKSYTIAAVAAEHMARGQSVLIVANNEVALDVIADKLASNFNLGDISIKAGQKTFLKQLKNYTADLLAGYFASDLDNSPNASEDDINQQNQLLIKLEHRFIAFSQKAIGRGLRLHKLELQQSKWLTRAYLFFTQRSINQWQHQWSALEAINQHTIERETLASNYLNALKKNNLKTLVNQHLKSLQAFNQAIRSLTSSKQLMLFEQIEYPKLFAAFPIWLVSLNSLHKVLPLNCEMFDLVIIDEATQCNISSCLPAFYRAKRALIVGDTKQLKHYSFLARSKQVQLLDKHKVPDSSQGAISYRDNSILDLALKTLSSDQELAFLDEHFRSKPELIHFSNQAFYHSKLKVMQHRPCTSSGHLHLHRVAGTRDALGVNEIEAQRILADIQTQITTDMQAGIAQSIGIISPFSAQAEQIAKLIELHIPQTDIIKHNIRAATPFGFQGEERDTMFISFAVDNRSKRAAAYLNKADVFNVTITRARQQQSIYLSIDESLLPEHNLLRQYIGSISAFHAEHSVTSVIDTFQQQIIEALKGHHIETWPGYAMVGTEIDLLCRFDNKYLAIDLIGFPGPWANFFELTTYKLFKRAGVEVLPVSYGMWIVDKQACVDKIIHKLCGGLTKRKT
ncbi:DEAD/DEAH box helicase [Shewanella livingstonensis]|uniref:DUF4011 domain-containing protein n=1 Tax=Shewanella livingstonensis TaxID=150120 RepID=A0A3G8LVA6_9GAMM|nr:AAA domain-containing protein [Shewanella livingstonensis]AZG72700.1 hypothetical protein EGC82_07890 [Shewanella livingstonensis]